jgi:hypothetical protein
MPEKSNVSSPHIALVAGLIFIGWYLMCFAAHAVDGTINAKTICLLGDVGAIAGLVLLGIKRKMAQKSLLAALASCVSFAFYMFNFDPSFSAYNITEILKPAVSVFIILTLIWYTHVATENKWIT